MIIFTRQFIDFLLISDKMITYISLYQIYSESSKDVFPADLTELCQYVASAIGFKDFNAEAAIVNFYHMDSTLSGHTDHSEDNLEAPLFSFRYICINYTN